MLCVIIHLVLIPSMHRRRFGECVLVSAASISERGTPCQDIVLRGLIDSFKDSIDSQGFYQFPYGFDLIGDLVECL